MDDETLVSFSPRFSEVMPDGLPNETVKTVDGQIMVSGSPH